MTGVPGYVAYVFIASKPYRTSDIGSFKRLCLRLKLAMLSGLIEGGWERNMDMDIIK
jgi:hypothetical protein